MSWPLVKIGDLATINPRLPKGVNQTQDVSFLGMASVSEEGRIIDQEIRILSETKKGFTYFERDDVLLAKITPCFENGKAVCVSELNTQIGFGSTEFHVIRAKDGVLDSKYLFYMIWSKRFRFYGERAMSGAAGQKRVPTDFVKNYEIPLPYPDEPEKSIKEQKRIVAILDKADTIRCKRKEAVKLSEDLLNSLFLDMFGDPVVNQKGWDIKPLKDQVIHANNGISRRRKEVDNVGDIVIRLQDVHYDGIRFNKELNRIRLDSKEKNRYCVDVGDILFIRVNGNPDYVGRSAVFKGFSEKIYHNDHLIRIKIGSAYLPEFISYCFNQKGGRKIISTQIKTSAGQHTISQGGIEQLEFYRPPLALQEKFVQVMTKVSQIPFGSFDGESLFDSLSQRAFLGEL